MVTIYLQPSMFVCTPEIPFFLVWPSIYTRQKSTADFDFVNTSLVSLWRDLRSCEARQPLIPSRPIDSGRRSPSQAVQRPTWVQTQKFSCSNYWHLNRKHQMSKMVPWSKLFGKIEAGHMTSCLFCFGWKQLGEKNNCMGMLKNCNV